MRTAYAFNEHLLSVFFDLEKAYDMTWRYGILQDLHDAGLRGRLPNYIAAFLTEREFRVRLEGYETGVRRQHNGVPQGSVLSVTLFTIKINSIVHQINIGNKWLASLYVDDFQISVRNSDINRAGAELQQCLNRVYVWAKRNGFRFSVTKTEVIHFTTLPGIHMNKPKLMLGDNELPYVETKKLLGLVWDTKLSWKPHIAKVRGECTKLLGILRMITGQKCEADQSSLLKVYRAFI